MKLYRIWAVILRHLLLTFRSYTRTFNIFYWSLLNVVIWGTTSVWIQQQSTNTKLMAMILTGLIFWQIVFRVNIETAKSLFEEFVNHNLVNLFSSPLTLSEWIVAIMALGVIDMILIIGCGIFAIWLLYSLNVFMLGWTIILSMLSLLLSGWFIGFIICSILITVGNRGQDFIYSVGYLFAPFSAIYYPVEALPHWVQIIAKFLPTTYIFESIRYTLVTNKIPYQLLATSFKLNLLYLSLSLIFFKYMFERSKKKGLARLE